MPFPSQPSSSRTPSRATPRGTAFSNTEKRLASGRTRASVVAIILALLAAKAFLYFAVSTAQDPVPYNNPVAGQIIGNLTRLFLLFGLVMFVRVRSVQLLLKEHLLSALFAWCVLSVMWSVYPKGSAVSIYRLIPFVLVGFWAISEGRATTIVEKMHLLCRAILYVNIASMVLFPPFAFMQGIHEGAMRGVFQTKNVLGLNLALCLCLFVPALLQRRTSLRIFDIVATLVLLILARSVTSVMCAAVVFGITAGSLAIRGLTPRRHMRIAFTLVLVVMLPALFAILLPLVENLLGFFGRDLTFTGRSTIWSFAIQAIHDKPWLGHGFRAFWQDPQSTIVGRGVIFFAHSHSGYIDAWLDGGIFEFVLLIAVFVSLAYRAVITALDDQAKLSTNAFPMLVIMTVITHNLAETSFPFDVYIIPVFVIAASVFCRLEAATAAKAKLIARSAPKSAISGRRAYAGS